MRPVARPSDDAVAVFHLCVARVRDHAERTRLTTAATEVRAGADEFEAAVQCNALHNIAVHHLVGPHVTTADMSWLYSQKVVRSRSPGRPLYDRLVMAPAFGRCPLCGERPVSSIDHHLPQALYPRLAVTPHNLVPACVDCNREKRNAVPTSPETHSLHPYFDDIEAETWLVGSIIESAPAAIQFEVAKPAGSSPVLQARVEHHVAMFRLRELYGSYAAQLLAEVRQYLRWLHGLGGAPAVTSHLAHLAESYSSICKNSWQAAAYAALSVNQWYCEGGDF